MGHSPFDPASRGRPAWNAGRKPGAKRPLKPQQVWAIRFWLDHQKRLRDRAMFDLAIDSKLHGCDVVKMKIGNAVLGGRVRSRATVVQQKTGKPVQFELLDPARASMLAWLKCRGGAVTDYVFPKVVAIMRDRIPRRFGLDPVRDVQVLWPMQRGATGARSLNAALQAALNPAPAARVERFGSLFLPGDKVMVVENDYEREVFNGDLGTVTAIDEEDSLPHANFDGRAVGWAFGELDALLPAYATTIHKSRGSKYPAVVVTLATQHHTMLARNLLYTAVTRGKRLVIVVGQGRALAIAVRTSTAGRRWTKLDEWLSQAC